MTCKDDTLDPSGISLSKQVAAEDEKEQQHGLIGPIDLDALLGRRSFFQAAGRRDDANRLRFDPWGLLFALRQC